ncbi:MAG: hypothetical protein BVN34_02770 [Proteobacteria bacterium ST_bin12]|nr:MAG: hypothetical protein BVN34_02770 [Proteobacteria bacterium ST_bin12]
MRNSSLIQLVALISGTLFGFGLLLSGMANPNKLLSFFDVSGLCDPSLILVMLGAILITSIGFRLLKDRTTTYLGLPINTEKPSKIDAKLIIGSALFGIGWGLAGICPGPAFVLAGLGLDGGFIFLFSVLTGFVIYAIILKTIISNNKI